MRHGRISNRLLGRRSAGQSEVTQVAKALKLEDAALIRKQLIATRDYAKAVIEVVPPLLVLDENLQVETANKSFCRCFKLSLRQALNRKVYELGNGEWDIPELRTLLEQVLPRHSFFRDFEVTHCFESIGARTMLLSGRQVNHLQKILLIIEDVTERRAAQAAIQISEIRYRRLFEAARDGILILDPETRKITESNPFMTELLGYPRTELLGKELWEIGLLKDEAASRAAFRELQKNHFIRYEDLPLQNKKGLRREVEFVSNLYRENGHEVIQCNIRDITERRRAERALLGAKDEIARHALELEKVVTERTGELRETIAELEGFSYSVSHDMRAPLRAMQSFAQYLVDEYGSRLDEQGVNYLQQIMRSAVRLDRLIQDVLSYTRILHAKLPMAPVNLDRLVRDIVDTFPNGQPIKPEIQINGTLPAVIANEALLAQCVSNLLSNGAKFVSPGITPHVVIWAEEAKLTPEHPEEILSVPPPAPETFLSPSREEGHSESSPNPLIHSSNNPLIRIHFQDNGIGIAPENHERIFRLFERIHPATDYEGTGIGLTIVRKATERMGAQVGFESEPGKGSNFWIQLMKG